VHAQAKSGYGFSLRAQRPEHRADRDIVLLAVKHSGKALKYAASRLRDDVRVVMASLKNQDAFHSGYKFASPRWKRFPRMIKYAVKGCSSVLQDMETHLQNDIELVELSIDSHYDAMRYLPLVVKENYNLNLRAVQSNYQAYWHTPGKFPIDVNIAIAATRQTVPRGYPEDVCACELEIMKNFWMYILDTSFREPGCALFGNDFGRAVLNCIAVPGEQASVFSIFRVEEAEEAEEAEDGFKLSAATMSGEVTCMKLNREANVADLARRLADWKNLKHVYLVFGDRSMTPVEGDVKIAHFASALGA
jgi:hypothetical protein